MLATSSATPLSGVLDPALRAQFPTIRQIAGVLVAREIRGIGASESVF